MVGSAALAAEPRKETHVNLDRMMDLAERARGRKRFSQSEIEFVRDELPSTLAGFPQLDLPPRFRHPAGFSVSGAPVGTFVRSALLLAGQLALGKRFDGVAFYEQVERDVAFRIMRSHFHHGYPKGTNCCGPCTLATLPVLEAGAIRYFDNQALANAVRNLVEQRQWRFGGLINAKMVDWALAA